MSRSLYRLLPLRAVSRSSDLELPAPTVLPFELVLAILCALVPNDSLEYVRHHPGRIALRNAALVCKRWYHSTIQLIYGDVRLHTYASCLLFLRTLTRRPNLGVHVRALHLPNGPSGMQVWNDGGIYSLPWHVEKQPKDGVHHTAPRIVSLCHNLRELHLQIHIQPGTAARVCRPFLSHLPDPATSPGLRGLHIRVGSMEFNECGQLSSGELLDLLADPRLTRLQEFSMSDVELLETGISPHVDEDRPLPKLTELGLWYLSRSEESTHSLQRLVSSFSDSLERVELWDYWAGFDARVAMNPVSNTLRHLTLLQASEGARPLSAFSAMRTLHMNLLALAELDAEDLPPALEELSIEVRHGPSGGSIIQSYLTGKARYAAKRGLKRVHIVVYARICETHHWRILAFIFAETGKRMGLEIDTVVHIARERALPPSWDPDYLVPRGRLRFRIAMRSAVLSALFGVRSCMRRLVAFFL